MPRRRSIFPFVALREQPDGSIRPRFVPGPRERALGFAPADIKRQDGSWMNLDEVRSFAVARHAEILAARQGQGIPVRAPAATVNDLLDDWLTSPDVKALRPKTQAGYRICVDAVRYRPRTVADRTARRERLIEPFGQAPVRAVGKPEVKAFFEYLVRARGLTMANAVIAVVRAAFSWGGLSDKWRLPSNPAGKLNLRKPQPRVVVWTADEVRTLIATADAMGRPSIGDSIMLAVYTGQRQGDRLALADAGLVAGRRRFVQSKTGSIVDIPETPQLAARLAQAAARVAAIKLARGLAEKPPTIVVCEPTARPWKQNNYQHRFDDVRAAAIAGIVDEAATAAARIEHAKAQLNTEPPTVWKVAPCPSIAGKRDQDFRDTAVTWLARAECTVPEIASITGHGMKSIYTILTHYLAITPELADSAITKLIAWMDRNGAAV